MAEGWIKLHRQIDAWEWYGDGNTFRLFIHLLLNANHKDNLWKGIEVKRGQCLTGRKALAKKLELSEQSIRTSLNRLKSTNEITIQSTSRYSLVTVENYNTYNDYDNENNQQNNQEDNQQVTSNQPTSNQQSTTNKNDKKGNNGKNDKKSNNRFIKPTIKEIEDFCSERNNGIDAVTFFNHYESQGWKIGKNKMTKWKSAIITWERNNGFRQGIKGNSQKESNQTSNQSGKKDCQFTGLNEKDYGEGAINQ
jgi:biotin operon repressor